MDDGGHLCTILGEVEVKHGERVHVFNFYTEDAGNSEPPKKVPPAKAFTGRKQRALGTELSRNEPGSRSASCRLRT